MLKVGILGSDNSHAERFSEILNLPDHPRYLPGADAKVVAIWGQEAERTAQVAQDVQIDTVVDNPEDMLGQVDAVICVTRHGGLHRKLVEPYLEAGIPTFVDKPLATDPNDARAIVELAERKGVPFSSFSTVKFSTDADYFLRKSRTLGGVQTGIYTGPASRRNPYGGVIFYAVHSIEMMLAVQGTGVEWVQAVEGAPADDAGNGVMSAFCAWADGTSATLELTVGSKYCFRATALGKDDIFDMTLNIGDCYFEGMKRILEILRGAESPVSAQSMIEAVQIGAAIDKSLDTGERVAVSSL